MAGLVPAIHVLPYKEGVDARHKAGHDGVWGEAGENRLLPKSYSCAGTVRR
jgi:hypothetical protein